MGRWALGQAMGAIDSEKEDMMLPMYIKSLPAPKDTETETIDLKFYGNPRHQARPSGTRTRSPTSRSDRGAGSASKVAVVSDRTDGETVGLTSRGPDTAALSPPTTDSWVDPALPSPQRSAS